MQPADKRKFLEIVNGMAAIKPGKPLTPAALDLFWNSMRRWSLDEFEQAANHLMTSVEFMPNPFHFEQLRKAGQKTAGEAWVGVLNGSALVPGSREARAAQVCGGQFAIRHANVERELPFMQRRFMEIYDELSEVDVVRDALPGIVDPDHQLDAPKELRALLKGVI
jgi:hypothetical protein